MTLRDEVHSACKEVQAMSQYTTGEVAKLCGVTVRTVQYYDTRGILIPSSLTEGGRRLYSDEDVKKMQVLCFLREIGLSISAIERILKEPEADPVIRLLLEEHQAHLAQEIKERQSQLETVQQLIRSLKNQKALSLQSIGDAARNMKNRKRFHRFQGIFLAGAILFEVMEVLLLILWVKTGQWLPFALALPVMAALAVWLSRYYFKHTAYICPHCQHQFKPRFKEAFWAYHTPRTRRLTCPECGKKSMCVETWPA